MRVSSFLLLALVGLLSVSLLVSAAPNGGGASDKVAKYNARVGAKFLAEKARQEGITALPSGVLYEKIVTGSGTRSPTASDKVKVHYAGTLIPKPGETLGQEFDSSYSRGSPAEFGVSGVIAGWTEVLQHMHEGDVWSVYIPSDKAYGARGSGAKIGPNATLVFKIELIEIVGGAKGGKKARKEEL